MIKEFQKDDLRENMLIEFKSGFYTKVINNSGENFLTFPISQNLSYNDEYSINDLEYYNITRVWEQDESGDFCLIWDSFNN